MPPSDYKTAHHHAAAVAASAPYIWLKMRTVVRNWKLRNETDAVEGHRVLGPKK